MVCASCAENKPVLQPVPEAAEVVVKYAPIDGALLNCMPKPAAAEALGRVEAIKATDAPPQKKAALIVGILNVMLLRYDLSDTDCRTKLGKIREVQGKTAPGAQTPPS